MGIKARRGITSGAMASERGAPLAKAGAYRDWADMGLGRSRRRFICIPRDPRTRGVHGTDDRPRISSHYTRAHARAPAARNGHVAWCIKQKQSGWCHVFTDSPSRPQVRCHGSAHPHGCHMCDGLVPVSRGQGVQGRRAPRPGFWAERGRRHSGERPGGASVDPTACWVESSLAGRRDPGEVEEDKPESILGSPRDSGRPLGRSDQLPGDLPPWGGAEVSALLTGSNGE